MIKEFCDRCSNEMKPGTSTRLSVKPSAPNPGKGKPVFPTLAQFHLCSSCTQRMYEALRMPPEVPPEALTPITEPPKTEPDASVAPPVQKITSLDPFVVSPDPPLDVSSDPSKLVPPAPGFPEPKSADKRDGVPPLDPSLSGATIPSVDPELWQPGMRACANHGCNRRAVDETKYCAQCARAAVAP